jgi:multiple sugar transport system permease protein
MERNDKMRHKKKMLVFKDNILAYIVLTIGGLIVLYPMIFMVLVALFTKEEYFSTVMVLFPFPKHVTLENFLAAFGGGTDASIQIYFFNSMVRTIYNVIFATITTLFGGYVFGRLRFKGRDTLFFILLATSMVPGTVSLIPTYIEYVRWPFAGGNNIFFGGHGILDSFWVYLISGPAINIMGTFIVKQYMETIPKEMDESAKIDGAGTFRLLFRILFPIARPIFAFVAITTAMGTWNDWVTPFFFTSSDKLQTMPAAIARLSNVSVSSIPNYPLIITLGLAVTLPALILFFVFQKYIVEGLANVGVKG